MKGKKRTDRIPSLQKGASDEEIIRWTRGHDVFERLEAQVSEVVDNMRIPPAMKAVLSRLARQRTTDATTLARIWLAERLQQELKARD